MIYKIEWSERAKDDLRSIGSAERKRIVRKVESHLIKDPLSLGKPLSGNLSGVYRYRIGDYRVLCHVHRNKLIILVLSLGHRKEVYGD